MKKLLKQLNDQKISILFSIIVTYWAMTSFFGMPIMDVLVIICILNIGMFACFSKLEKLGIAGGLIFILGSVVYFMVVEGIILFSGESNLQYVIWIISSKPESVTAVAAFVYATILIASYGVTSTVFYFTQVQYRVAALLLIGVIAFLLQSAKTDSDITVQFVAFGIVFFWLYVERTVRKECNTEKNFYKGNLWYILSVLAYIGAVMLLSVSMPKPERIPRLAYINQVIAQTVQNLAQGNIQNIDIGLNGVFNTLNIKNQSVIDSSSSSLGEEVLFEVEANEPLYFRIQSWDMYNENRWLKGNKELDEMQELSTIRRSYYQLPVLIELMQDLNKRQMFPEGYPQIEERLSREVSSLKLREARVYTKGVNMEVLLNPPGVISFEIKDNPTVYINERAECHLPEDVGISMTESYGVDYFSQRLPSAMLENTVVKSLNKELVEEITDEDKYSFDEDDEGVEFISDVVSDMLWQMEVAYDNYVTLPEDTPQRIYELSNSITTGITGDYNKAMAIVDYFNNNGFKYDLTPPKLTSGMDYNDFFIFESKQGICMHFASAMTVLARASGLPARYVEGFIADEWDLETDRYLIREKDAHAFVEVYIAGYGWMVFEPTVALDESGNKVGVFFDKIFRAIGNVAQKIWRFIVVMPPWVKILFIPYIIFSVLALIWLACRMRRNAWRKKVLSSDGSKSVMMVFSRILRLLKKMDIEIKRDETPSSYADRVRETSGIDLTEFTACFNDCRYGGVNPDETSVSRAIRKYDEVRDCVKRKLGKLRAWYI